MADVVIVICKPPVPGFVKTRMCPPLSPEQAAALARGSLADTFAACQGVAAGRHVAVIDAPTSLVGLPVAWIPPGWEVVAQRTGGLDARLAGAFEDVLQPGESAVLVAMDTPQATTIQIQDALDALRTHDSVIGMTDDGGYWIVGLNAARAEVFVGVPMSTDATGAAQLARLESLGLSVATVDQLRDLDTIDDVRSVAQEHPHLMVSQWFVGIEPAVGHRI